MFLYAVCTWLKSRLICPLSSHLHFYRQTKYFIRIVHMKDKSSKRMNCNVRHLFRKIKWVLLFPWKCPVIISNHQFDSIHTQHFLCTFFLIRTFFVVFVFTFNAVLFNYWIFIRWCQSIFHVCILWKFPIHMGEGDDLIWSQFSKIRHFEAKSCENDQI